MARSLIEQWTQPGDLVADPFCGCGVVALESARAGRRVIAGDWNPYAVVLTRAKLFAPNNLQAAQRRLQRLWRLSRELVADQDLRQVPIWVRRFFHPATLRNALAFRDACVEHGDSFLLACLLGILHHQRPGFLSYPSSHLVPYLRDRKFPREHFPDMYEERDVLVRLQAKLTRTFQRPPGPFRETRKVFHVDARRFPRIKKIGSILTSPPYMNELDYLRDNRLRLWFVERSLPTGLDLAAGNREAAYTSLIRSVFIRLEPVLESGGHIILVVGDVTRGGRATPTAELTKVVFECEPALKHLELVAFCEDIIPDIRRSRRECRGTKGETILVFRKRRPTTPPCLWKI